MRQLPPLPFHNKITVPATISGCKKKLKLQATNSILPSPGGLPQMMRGYQILVGLALISASSLRTRLANISYQTRTFFPLTLLKSLPPPSFKRVAGTSHFVLFKGADCGEKTPCLQIQMFKKKKKAPVQIAAAASLGSSHHALPGHQRETKMANVLGENEPFVIF